MRHLVLLPLLLSSCFSSDELAVVQSLSPRKQKQKIAFLQKKLEGAQKEQKKAEAEVEKLNQAIDLAQLALIRKQVDDYEREEGKSPFLFLGERETLHGIIESGPSPSAFEAQVELDRILRLITEASSFGSF